MTSSLRSLDGCMSHLRHRRKGSYKGVNLHPPKIFDDQSGSNVSVHFADGN